MVGVMKYSVQIGQLFTRELINILIELKKPNTTPSLFIHACNANHLSIVSLTDQASIIIVTDIDFATLSEKIVKREKLSLLIQKELIRAKSLTPCKSQQKQL